MEGVCVDVCLFVEGVYVWVVSVCGRVFLYERGLCGCVSLVEGVCVWVGGCVCGRGLCVCVCLSL